MLEAEQAPVLDSIGQAMNRVLDVLAGKEYEEQKRSRYFEQFRELRDGAERCNNVSTLRSFGDKAEALKLRLLGEMDTMDVQLAQRKAAEKQGAEKQGAEKQGAERQAEKTGAPSAAPEPPAVCKVRRTRRVPIRQMTGTASWRLESAEDVDRYLAQLREKLTAQLDADTIINVEF